MPRDPNAPKPGDAPKYHIKGDPLGRASFPKPDTPKRDSDPLLNLGVEYSRDSDCSCGWQDCTFCGGDGW